MKRKRIILAVTIILLASAILSVTIISLNVKTEVKELFRLNKTLQEEGYYMAEFEFQMVGFSYYLGKGRYLHALRELSDYHAFLSDRENLIKIPDFKTNQEEIDFYLNLQNPKTGAFMNEYAPFCAYFSNTENMLLHLEALQDSTTESLKLKYPLSFLDIINTPEKLQSYLNDISYMNWIGAKFPQTTFHFARDMLSNARPDNVIERNYLYSFSPQWKYTMLKWMYDFQDTETGLWGSKDKKTNKLLKHDISNTYSIVKKYKNTNGNDIYEDFPLRYQDKLFKFSLEQLKEPLPDEDELSSIHEWNLVQAKGIKMLLSRLWKNVSSENKEGAKKIIANFIEVSFDKYYVEKDGAFSYYPNSEHATVDGMNNMILKRIGALSYERQKSYWGEPEENAKDLGIFSLDTINAHDLDSISNIPDINSWRIYTVPPNYKALFENVWAIYYPKETKVLDITELVPNIKQWTETSTLSTGNWKSMADIKNEYASINIKKPLIFRNKLPYSELNFKMKESSVIHVIGVDMLQIPKFRVKFKNEYK